MQFSRRIPLLSLHLSDFRESPVSRIAYATLLKDGKPITIVRVEEPSEMMLKRPEEAAKYCRYLIEMLLVEVYAYYYSHLWC